MKNILKKRWWMLLIIAVLMALLLEIIQINTQPVVYKQEKTEDIILHAEEIYPAKLADVHGYKSTNSGLIVENSDPQMILSTEKSGSFSYVYFSFYSQTENESQIQVFYPDDEGKVTELCSVKDTCAKGTEFRAIEIPEKSYEFLRIDIDGTVIPLESICVGSVPVSQTAVSPRIHIKRLLINLIMLWAVLLWITWIDGWRRIWALWTGGLRELARNGKKTGLYALLFPAFILISIGFLWICQSRIAGKTMTSYHLLFAGLVGFFAASLLVLRKSLEVHPEIHFLILVLCVGFLYAWSVPHTGLNSWDEDVHYSYALNMSYMDSTVMTKQDYITMDRFVPASFDTHGEIQQLHEQQDIDYRTNAAEVDSVVQPVGYPEIFNGIGLFLGRALGLRYYLIHFLGRFTGLITYAIVCFFAIRILKSGKMIASVSLLIPTEIFIASSYNYDCYLTGFTALGLCYYISEWQNRDQKLSLKNAVIMFGSIAFGCLTKPVYVPLLWILLLLPRDKFRSKRDHTLFILAMVLITGLLIISYIIPSLQSGTEDSYTDFRGGEGVSASGQLHFIISHPFEYVRTVLRYLMIEYMDLSRIGEALTNMAYHSVQPNQYVYFALMAVVAFTDKNRYDRSMIHHPWVHMWPIFLSLCTTIMVITAMYLAFTPVGAERVNGAQFRYLIPIALPVLMYIGSGKVENNMNRGWYNGMVLGIAAFVEFSCVYNAFICRYF